MPPAMLCTKFHIPSLNVMWYDPCTKILGFIPVREGLGQCLCRLFAHRNNKHILIITWNLELLINSALRSDKPLLHHCIIFMVFWELQHYMVVDCTYRRSFKFRHFMSAGLLASHDLQTLLLDITNTARANECMAYPHMYILIGRILYNIDRITLQSL
jgi:hypothetical protein